MSNVLKETVKGIDLIPIDDMLMEESQIFLIGDINSETANEFIKKLMPT